MRSHYFFSLPFILFALSVTASINVNASFLFETSPQKIIPELQDFPGKIEKNAERTETLLSLHCTGKDYAQLRLQSPPVHQQSTGLFKVQNEKITISITPDEFIEEPELPELMIGAHTDNLTGIPEDKRERAAIQSESLQLKQGENNVDSPMAGLIYLKCHPGTQASFSVYIKGAVKAPYYKLEKNNLKEWQNTIRSLPAPWTELEGYRSG